MPLFLPLDDHNPRLRLSHPWVNWSLIALCIAVFAVQVLGPGEIVRRLVISFGTIPYLLLETPLGDWHGSPVPPLVTPLTYGFLHGNIVHLFVNMLVLWVYGDNVEDAMGHWRYLVFYTGCGILAVLSQVAIDPASLAPIIGASGAIAGVMGAYLVLFPRARLLVPIIIFPVYLPAYLVLSLWMLFQVIAALQSNSATEGVAWWAHIGGFIAGALFVKLFRHQAHLNIAPGDLPRGVELQSFGRDRNAKRARSRRE